MPYQLFKALILFLLAMTLLACASGSKKLEGVKVNQTPKFVKPILMLEHQQAYDLAVTQIKNGQHDPAAESLNQLLKLYPALAGAYVNLGIISESKEELDAAEEYYLTALDINPSNGDALLQLGKNQMASGEFSAAEKSLLGALESSAVHPAVYFNLGVLYELYLQQYDEAIDYYEAYVEQGQGGDIEVVKRWIKLLERK